MELSTDALHNRLHERLVPHGSEDLQAQLASVVDLTALEERRYEEVLDSVNSRLSAVRYTLLSMLAAGIYFGLLVGTWLVDFTTAQGLTLWGVPVLLVTVYAIYAADQSIREFNHLSEAQSLLRVLVDRSPPTNEPS